jgi:hypothetical protein
VHHVSNDGVKIEFATLQESCHLIPSSPKFPPYDPLQINPFENDVVEPNRLFGFAVYAKERNPATGPDGVDREGKLGGVTRHLKDDIDATRASMSDFREWILGERVKDRICPDFACRFRPELADFGGKHLRRSGGLTNGDGHLADRSHPGDQNCTTFERTGHGGMNCITQRVLECRDEGRNFSGSWSGVLPRNHRVLCEAAVDINTEDDGVRTNVRLTLEALDARSTHDVRLAGHKISDRPFGDPFTKLHNRSAELVANDARRLDSSRGPFVPVVDVQIGAADGRRLKF